MSSLKERIEQGIKSGNLSLSSADVAAANEVKAPAEPIVGTVKAEVDPSQALDGLAKAAEKGEGISAMAAAKIEVEITAEERDAFIEAIISGTRYQTRVSLFNDKFAVVFRSRSQAESSAIVAQLARELHQGRISFEIEYGSRLRAMLLAAQVAEMNGVAMTTLRAPLLATLDGKELTNPGWLDQVAYWENQSEGLVEALYTALQTFEYKYWIMVRNAASQNFWNPAAST